MSRRRRALSLALALAGAALVANGLYIPAKALLAQALLERAWTRAQAGDDDARPWSWADTAPIARLRLPRLSVETIALEGASGRTLAFGPGHVTGTARPGAPGNVVLAGHRDTHFAFLREVRVGDEVQLEARSGDVRRYQVEEAFVVDEKDTWVLAPATAATLTLITCWPFDAVTPGGPERYVVIARELTGGAADSIADGRGQQRGSGRERQLIARRGP